MPPKKKDSSKTPAKARTPTLIDGLTKEELSKEQIEEHIVRLREELDREREERNYFQLERDKIYTTWKITERQLEEVKAELKNLDNHTEKDEERHHTDIKVYQQKMKHLLCEHTNTIFELKADGSVSNEKLQKEQEQLEMELRGNMTDTLAEMQEADKESFIKELEQSHAKNMTMTRNNLEEKLKDLIDSYKKNIEMLKEDLEKITTSVTCEREHQWNSHIASLKEHHAKTMSGFDDIVSQMEKDLDEIIAHKKEIKELTINTRELEKSIESVLEDNKRLVELISTVKKEKTQAEKKVKYYIEGKILWKRTEKDRHKKLRDLKQDHEQLEEKFIKLQQEVGERSRSFAQSVQELQHQADVKEELLKKKLQSVKESVEKTHAQLSSVLSASNMDHTALTGNIKKMEEKLDSANNTIKDLEYRRRLVARAHRDLLLFIEAKEAACGVPVK
ncbi:dynein regulatory complex subunit 4-like [Parambassis ranga]|uniref:Dynein regulatory complex subunit 4 n=1 Tax=Parambassis ranga TaxID=210632 RepID=A0A6P7IEY6_9TELE|nr:dynein regulatory complex subunit 4-like [Parambassis ranga]